MTSGADDDALADIRELFITIVGHDLRTPLSAIMLSSEALLERGHLDDRDQSTVNRILKNTNRMTGMITQLLEVTRARLGGGVELALVPADLGALAHEVAGQRAAGAVQVQLEGDLTGTWDPERLAEALVNLVGNAIDHAAAGTAVVVKAHPVGAEVVLDVSNQGEPIAADVLPTLFEPFRRGRGRKSRSSGNLGLGLYLTSEIVRAHGGTIAARSADGTTTFTLRLPRAR